MAARSIANWVVGPFKIAISPVAGAIRVPWDYRGATRHRGASITDEVTGLRYEAVIDEDGTVIYLGMYADDGPLPERPPLRRIAEQVRLQLAAEEAAGRLLFRAANDFEPEDRTPEQVAELWQQGHRRREIAKLLHCSESTADRLIRKARKAKLITDPATTGRNFRKTTTTDEDM